MEFRTLDKADIAEILRILNLSFSDYIVPYQLSMEQFEEKISTENISFELSAGVFIKDKLVGLILHGVNENKTRVYNGGTGVIPKRRGKGIASMMFKHIIPILKSNKISSMVLEVLTTNTPAIECYEKIGFKIDRRLNCYDGEMNLDKYQVNVSIETIDKIDWVKFKSFCDIKPAWQYAKEAISKMNNLTTYVAKLDNEIVGYLIYNKLKRRLIQIAVAKDKRRSRIATSLLNSVDLETGFGMNMINVDDSNESINSFLINANFNLFIQQYEMKMVL